MMDIDKGFTQKHLSPIGIGELMSSSNQKQSFLPITVQMCRKEAIEWATNTKKAWLESGGESWFNPLILEHNYETTTLYLIAKPAIDGWKANEKNECILEILIN